MTVLLSVVVDHLVMVLKGLITYWTYSIAVVISFICKWDVVSCLRQVISFLLKLVWAFKHPVPGFGVINTCLSYSTGKEGWKVCPLQVCDVGG